MLPQHPSQYDDIGLAATVAVMSATYSVLLRHWLPLSLSHIATFVLYNETNKKMIFLCVSVILLWNKLLWGVGSTKWFGCVVGIMGCQK